MHQGAVSAVDEASALHDRRLASLLAITNATASTVTIGLTPAPSNKFYHEHKLFIMHSRSSLHQCAQRCAACGSTACTARSISWTPLKQSAGAPRIGQTLARPQLSPPADKKAGWPSTMRLLMLDNRQRQRVSILSFMIFHGCRSGLTGAGRQGRGVTDVEAFHVPALALRVGH